MVHGWKAVDPGAPAEYRPAATWLAALFLALAAAAVYALVVVYPRG
jgi:hypothetical protein